MALEGTPRAAAEPARAWGHIWLRGGVWHYRDTWSWPVPSTSGGQQGHMGREEGEWGFIGPCKSGDTVEA